MIVFITLASLCQVFVLGNRGSGKSRVLKALRLGDDLLYQGRVREAMLRW